jgi:hypothetical protein
MIITAGHWKSNPAGQSGGRDSRHAQATGLPGILDAAYDAFEGMLLVIHGQEDRAGEGSPRSWCQRRRQRMAVTR